MRHCWPSKEQIVEKSRAFREQHLGLKRVYVLTNGWGWWVNEFRNELRRDGWEEIKSSLDVQLDNEQKYVSMTIDMAIAECAEVFVGNRVSKSYLLFIQRFDDARHINSPAFHQI